MPRCAHALAHPPTHDSSITPPPRGDKRVFQTKDLKKKKEEVHTNKLLPGRVSNDRLEEIGGLGKL